MDTVSTPSDEGSGISGRKAKHLEICVDPASYSVESGRTLLGSVRFLHGALPEIDERSVDTSMEFLGHRIALPLLVSCMTGGSESGINRELAIAAEEARIPVGMGSIRVLLDDESLFEQFHMKPFAPDVPVIANLGAVQLREIPHPAIFAMLERLEVQAIAIHLNPGQELFQPDGDRDFRGLREAIARLCEKSPVPVIVKETGFGIRPSDVDFLLEAGAAYVDVAGAGGTNWILVESHRLPAREGALAREFDDWGIPTAAILAALRDRRPRGAPRPIIASGGVRTGSDVAKTLALGASLAGLALPFIRAARSSGAPGVRELVSGIERSLRVVMTLSGCLDLRALRRAPIMVESPLALAVGLLAKADVPSRARKPAPRRRRRP